MSQLEDLLQQCTVKLSLPGRMGWGTGFFVAPGFILTCAHVVQEAKGQPVQVRWQNQENWAQAVVERSLPDPYDLALLRVTLPTHANPVCVYLDTVIQSRDPLYLFGYPDQDFPSGCPVTFNCEGLTGDEPALIKFALGQVRPGVSGSPLLNQRTGKVCGIVKFTRDRSFDLGGGAIPTRVILEQFPELRDLQRELHQQDQQWANLLKPIETSNSSSCSITITGDANSPIVAGDNNVVSSSNVVQHGKYNIHISEGKDIQIGDRTYVEINQDEVKAIAAAIQQKASALSPGQIGFEPYLRSLLDDDDYQKWQALYMPLRVEKVKPKEKQKGGERDGLEQQEQVEQWDVLEGLRHYALNHVLLIGKPGSGKSTVLQQRLWEEAQTALTAIAKGETDFTIPVLIKLRDRKEEAIVNRIHEKLRRRLRPLDIATIEELLMAGRFLLLFDGLNEIPTSAVWSELQEFQHEQDFRKNPRIFTTRELGVETELGIEAKLALLPLTDLQMRTFIEKRLLGQTDSLLHQLKDRLRELAETPLLLKMLCDVVKDSPEGYLPTNRGELFHQEFARRYQAFKPKRGYVSDDSHRLTEQLLQQLAFRMIQGDSSTEPKLQIPKDQAIRILQDFLQTQGEANTLSKASEYLEDLLEWNLLQVASDTTEIEFHHQLFQEYYAAEYLLKLLSNLTDDQLKRDYLNYLKWTEPVALMLALVDEETQALRVVQLALEVDLMLGAWLAGEVKPEFQEQTVGLLTRLMEQNNLPEWLKVELWGRTRSTFTIASLIKLFNEYDFELPDHISEIFFHNVAENYSSLDLLEALDIEDSIICSNIAEILRGFSLDQEVPDFQQLPKSQDITHNAENKFVDKNCLRPSVSELITNLKSENIWERERATSNLGEIRAEQAIPELVSLLEDENHHVRKSASLALGKIASDHAIPALVQMMESQDEDPEFCQMVGLGYGLINICKVACETLANIRSELAIAALLKASKHRHYYIRREAIRALGTIGSDEIILTILESLHDVHGDVCVNAAQTLGDVGLEIAISELLIALKDGGSLLRESAAEALGKIGLEKAVPGLLAALEDEESDVVETASWALVKIGSEHGLKGILLALESPDDFVRRNAADVLGQITSIQSIPSLFKALEDDVNDVRWSAAETLGKFKGDRAAHILPNLLTLLPSQSGEQAFKAIQAIQANCKYYNYEIFQAHLAAQKADRPSSQTSDRSVIYEVNTEVVQIVENNYGTIHGKQTP
jgi:HEAT repeat protein